MRSEQTDLLQGPHFHRVLQRAGESQPSTPDLSLEAVGGRGMEVVENPDFMQIGIIIHLFMI